MKSKLQYLTFVVSPVSFTSGERDPFGFDDFAEKLGAEYLPFSGSVGKPSYFLFVQYVNYILTKNLIPCQNEKERQEVRIRLEKLLVYSWKCRHTKEELRSASVLGNSYETKDIDLSTSKGWVVQNSFRIYTEKNFVPQTLELYLKLTGEKHIPILKEFLNTEYRQNAAREKYIKGLLKRLGNKHSLFANHILEAKIRSSFKKELIFNIRKKQKQDYLTILLPFFTYKNINSDRFFKQLLEKKNLPFFSLNEWFNSFISAVDADLQHSPKRNIEWQKADAAFDLINQKSTPKSDLVLNKRMKQCKWFQYNEKDGQYILKDGLSPYEKSRYTTLWESYKKRQGEDIDNYFFNYRHYALFRLLRELI